MLGANNADLGHLGGTILLKCDGIGHWDRYSDSWQLHWTQAQYSVSWHQAQSSEPGQRWQRFQQTVVAQLRQQTEQWGPKLHVSQGLMMAEEGVRALADAERTSLPHPTRKTVQIARLRRQRALEPFFIGFSRKSSSK